MKLAGDINLGELQHRLLSMYAAEGYRLDAEKAEMLLDNLSSEHYFLFVKRDKEGYKLSSTYYTLRGLGLLKP